MTDAYRDAIFPESITKMGKILKLFLHIVFISAGCRMKMREDAGDFYMPQ